MENDKNFNKIMQKLPRCPLCLGPMENAYDSIRKVAVVVCHRDAIAIALADPLLGRWEEKAEKIPCPNCNAAMRVFFTSTGYMQAFCPKKKCGCRVKSADNALDKKATPAAGPVLKNDGIA